MGPPCGVVPQGLGHHVHKCHRYDSDEDQNHEDFPYNHVVLCPRFLMDVEINPVIAKHLVVNRRNSVYTIKF